MDTAGESDEGRIRPAERADLLAVHRIETEAFPQPWPFGAFEQYLGEPGFLVAANDEVRGYVIGDTVSNHGQTIGHIKNLAVHSDHRNRGLGTALLSRGMAVLAARGGTPVKLEVRESNESARALYQSHGFEHRATVEDYYNDGEDALLLVCEQ